MIRIIKCRLKTQTGESIAEVLVALLISSLALVMLASMISATNSMVKKSETVMNEYYDCNNELEVQPPTTTYVTKTSGSITITGTNFKKESISVDYYENNSLVAKVYSYKP
ncbi:MAG: hypothetical protein IKS55_13120 [Oscillospiraceae bacterium]|nr:hypothetical protein [Oscillospiraceae bacterium]